ncbi:aldehyde dehydrogenase (NADP(+)) [Enterovibrio norvegicus]|uniref:aldehyde dehydrogenase (NADP(+)) n=1 Tax=Enterovibrio norvegicus TaxID=188144 RepID=UPI0002DCE33D|nr:aldehyde dehydrogenase (NADP(+)) [Enterovibrio norvegicus]OEF58135.1 2,5-dioxovalerate dehydrogenase [Enterovibrio norvegicus]
MSVQGNMFIGGRAVHGTNGRIQGFDPKINEKLEPSFGLATCEDADEACVLAAGAFQLFRKTSASQRADLLRLIADNIMALGDTLIERGMKETGLPAARLEGERARTANQLRLFADVIQDGSWQDVRIDTALPDRQPLPRPFLGVRKIPLGPVVVFGSSNFPLAFSVAGGDTASALAAGCPVIVKGHSAHPGVSELIGRCIVDALAELNFHPGTFSLVFGSGNEIGQHLVSHPEIKAVGFTGSQSGGTALMSLAQQREEPIPVYAEMSSINPVVFMPASLAAQTASLAEQFYASLMMGAGQFCTNPGLVIALKSEALTHFKQHMSKLMEGNCAGSMLTPSIFSSYCENKSALINSPEVNLITQGHSEGHNACEPAFVEVEASDFIKDRALHREVFGSFSMLVVCNSEQEALDVLGSLEGQLTGTIHYSENDDQTFAQQLIDTMELKVGRILFNGFPTGVEVSTAMVHGGPYPSTSNSQTTSVGSMAIERFVRPVCYQNVPNTLLPPEIKPNNPLSIPRHIDGEPEKR